jgi:hypothetical protein
MGWSDLFFILSWILITELDANWHDRYRERPLYSASDCLAVDRLPVGPE